MAVLVENRFSANLLSPLGFLGFLFAYAVLVTHESDFRIAKEMRLIPEDLQKAAWKIAVVQLWTSLPPVLHVDRHFDFSWKTPLHGYMSRWNQYGSFFHDNFVLASSTVYMGVVLTAMQVDLAAEAL
ncbi:hypothetical protein COL940_011398 [Colletotrichum noveboracense]|nr:hypothetical protein COL940_011398 [Colletotrichum noveboracense]KAJ0274299.1 hypothetical protein CBS470a_011845 [Colletotrichum nupharicola]